MLSTVCAMLGEAPSGFVGPNGRRVESLAPKQRWGALVAVQRRRSGVPCELRLLASQPGSRFVDCSVWFDWVYSVLLRVHRLFLHPRSCHVLFRLWRLSPPSDLACVSCPPLSFPAYKVLQNPILSIPVCRSSSVPNTFFAQVTILGFTR